MTAADSNFIRHLSARRWHRHVIQLPDGTRVTMSDAEARRLSRLTAEQHLTAAQLFMQLKQNPGRGRPGLRGAKRRAAA